MPCRVRKARKLPSLRLQKSVYFVSRSVKYIYSVSHVKVRILPQIEKIRVVRPSGCSKMYFQLLNFERFVFLITEREKLHILNCRMLEGLFSYLLK